MAFNLHLLVDRSPELPYFIIASFYLLSSADAYSVHIFSTAFLFVMTSLAVGLALKAVLKTKRPVRHYNIPLLRYDFPSLHSMISIGTIVFVYYVKPLYSVILIPIGLFYLYSRIKIRAHSLMGVAGGAVLGIVLGFLFGTTLESIHLPEMAEIALAVMLFCMPLFTAIFRVTCSERRDF